MNVRIELPTNIEMVLQRRAAAAGKDLVTFLRQVITESEESEVAEPTSEGTLAAAPLTNLAAHNRLESQTEFQSQLRGIIARHGIQNGQVDDSRESIYEGCGE